jgi:hypothetical protein
MDGMHCSNCGKEIAPFDAKLDIQFPQGRSTARIGLPIKVISVPLCADCAKSREAVKRTMLWAFALFFIVLATLALIGGLFTQWR